MIAFRCTPEEHKPICEMAAWSGINRQNFIIAKLIESQVEVRPHERAESAERLDDGGVGQGSATGDLLRRTPRRPLRIVDDLDRFGLPSFSKTASSLLLFELLIE